MSLIRKHVAVLQAWACLALVFQRFWTTLYEHPLYTVVRDMIIALDVKVFLCLQLPAVPKNLRP